MPPNPGPLACNRFPTGSAVPVTPGQGSNQRFRACPLLLGLAMVFVLPNFPPRTEARNHAGNVCTREMAPAGLRFRSGLFGFRQRGRGTVRFTTPPPRHSGFASAVVESLGSKPGRRPEQAVPMSMRCSLPLTPDRKPSDVFFVGGVQPRLQWPRLAATIYPLAALLSALRSGGFFRALSLVTDERFRPVPYRTRAPYRALKKPARVTVDLPAGHDDKRFIRRGGPANGVFISQRANTGVIPPNPGPGVAPGLACEPIFR